MGEILQIQPNEHISKPEIEIVEKEKMEYTFLAKAIRTRGLKLFAYNYKEESLNEVVLKENKVIALKQDLSIKKESKLRADVDTSSCIYFEALNFMSALKRLSKFQAGKIKDLRNLRGYNANALKVW